MCYCEFKFVDNNVKYVFQLPFKYFKSFLCFVLIHEPLYVIFHKFFKLNAKLVMCFLEFFFGCFFDNSIFMLLNDNIYRLLMLLKYLCYLLDFRIEIISDFFLDFFEILFFWLNCPKIEQVFRSKFNINFSFGILNVRR